MTSEALVIRPTLPSVLMSCGYAAAGATLCIAGVAVSSAWGVGLVSLGTVLVICGWRSATSRLVAGKAGIEVRNHWKTKVIPWDAVVTISQGNVSTSLGRFPYSSPWNRPHRFGCGTLELRDGSFLIPDALVSVRSSELGVLASPSQTKTDILKRWANEA